jgi:DNA-binding transcriptional LysR family regulator
VTTATLSLLPPALRLFREQFGGVELDLREFTSGEQIEALHEGEIRVGLVRLPLCAATNSSVGSTPCSQARASRSA